MYKKTRLRIFALIMAAATVIITLMLAVIYIANAHYGFERDISLLERYIEDNGREFHPEFAPARPGVKPGPREEHNRMFRLSTFYSVFYDRDGNVDRIDSNGGVLYSEEEIQDTADRILAGGRERGICSGMPFLVKCGSGGTIVALIDNTMESDNSGRLFACSLAAGCAGWTVVLVLAWVFSKKIVTPLEESDRKQKQFISDAGHELKTPVCVISANADLLSAQIGENKWLANIQYENERMGNLVRQLLELVRAENMQQTGQRLDFSRLVSGGTLPFESVAYEAGRTLSSQIEDGIFVSGNPGRLSQLVSILIDNALTYGTPGTEVSVKLSSSKHHAVLSVINSGEPIPDEIREHLFERFYRADEARTDDAGHYGLGLAIAKAVVAAHGGKIEMLCYDGLIEVRAALPA